MDKGDILAKLSGSFFFFDKLKLLLKDGVVELGFLVPQKLG